MIYQINYITANLGKPDTCKIDSEQFANIKDCENYTINRAKNIKKGGYNVNITKCVDKKWKFFKKI